MSMFFNKCREEITADLNEFGNRWFKRQYVEHAALKEWKLSSLKINTFLSIVNILIYYLLN